MLQKKASRWRVIAYTRSQKRENYGSTRILDNFACQAMYITPVARGKMPLENLWCELGTPNRASRIIFFFGQNAWAPKVFVSSQKECCNNRGDNHRIFLVHQSTPSIMHLLSITATRHAINTPLPQHICYKPSKQASINTYLHRSIILASLASASASS